MLYLRGKKGSSRKEEAFCGFKPYKFLFFYLKIILRNLNAVGPLFRNFACAAAQREVY